MRIISTAVLSMAFAGTLAAQGNVPLEASLRRGMAEPLFQVNQPAYVAVFEVLPGMGVQQIYPNSAWQAQQMVQPGEYLLSRPLWVDQAYRAWSRSRPMATPMYVVDGFGNVRNYYYATAWTGPMDFRPGRTLLMVASRQPLRQVSSPMAASNWLQRTIGFQSVANSLYAPPAMLDQIVEAVTPVGATADDFVVDVLEIMDPGYGAGYNRSGQVISFNCNGQYFTLTADFFFEAGIFRCPYQPFGRDETTPWKPPTTPWDTTAPPPPKPVQPLPPDPTGDPTDKVPGRKRPQPDGTRIGIDLGGSNGLDLMGRSTVTIGGIVPITYDGNHRGGVNPATGAWVPATPSQNTGDYGFGSGRFTPAGNGNSSSSGTFSSASNSSGFSGPGGTSNSGASAASVPGNSVAAGSAGARHASRPVDP